MIELHIVKGDKVKVIAGKDKGKTGKVLRVMVTESRVVVDGINKVKKHAKPTKDMPKGGIIEKFASIHSSNVQPICPACKKTVRVGKVREDSKVKRVCKSCGDIWELSK